jgi:peptidoglycan/xylan/chitin deacetylase (PgdA/CDA1 family)
VIPLSSFKGPKGWTISLRKPRRVLRWLWARFLAASGCLWWAKRQLRDDGAIVTLIFHRVLSEPSYRKTNSQPEIIIREQTFRELVAHVARCCEAVDLEGTTPGTPGSKPKVAFTFDDGWEDNYGVVFPIAREYRIPFMIFVCSELVGKKAPFWPEQVIALERGIRPLDEDAEIQDLIERLKECTPEERERRLTELSEQASKRGVSLESSSIDGTLSWTEIAEMDRAGVRFGSHTQTHQILTNVGTETARQEVLGSRATLAKALGKECNLFSYPNGNWSSDAQQVVAEAGYKKAFALKYGAWTSACDPLCIPRINVYEGTVVGLTGRFSPALFDYATFWKAWRAIKSESCGEVRDKGNADRPAL